ncbi:carbonate dehydratase [Kaarinaea lacus]
MKDLKHLLEKNITWASGQTSGDPDFFNKLLHQQSPEYLWIGCSDSRVPANEIVGLPPGELFVHRNVANIVVHSDLNCLSVIQYAVDVLKVKHIIVCGHYGCGGVRAAIDDTRLGLIDNWLQHIKDIRGKHREIISTIANQHTQHDLLCELNVIEQVVNVCYTTIAQDAWARKQELVIHGWIYAINDGILKDLDVVIDRPDDIKDIYSRAIKQYY